MLRAAWASPLMPEFVSSLPLGAVDGTLRGLLLYAGYSSYFLIWASAIVLVSKY